MISVAESNTCLMKGLLVRWSAITVRGDVGWCPGREGAGAKPWKNTTNSTGTLRKDWVWKSVLKMPFCTFFEAQRRADSC